MSVPENEVFKMEIISAEDGLVTFKLRIRGYTNWYFTDDLKIQAGGSIIVTDQNQKEGVVGLFHANTETELVGIPRVFNIDIPENEET